MRRPNILLLHCHDIGRFLGCYGVPTVCTPALDAYAAEGVAFARAFATAPQCSPSRASLFTGRYPHSNGVLGLTHEDFAWDLHADERHLAVELRDAGYQTALVGVHHESRTATADRVGAQLGFDTVQLGGLADVVSDRAIALLHAYRERDAAAPFYLQVGYLEPHRLPGDRDNLGVMGFLGNHIEPDDARGVTVPPYLIDDSGARTEVAELQGAARHMDAALGRVLAALADTGLADDTIVVFTTDHGVALPRAKCTLYDPGLEVALIVRWPSRGWTGGRWVDPLVSNVDVFPTLLAAAGLPVSERIHGRSLLSLLDGGEHQPRAEVFGQLTYHDYYDPRRCIRTRTHKLIANFSSAPAFMDSSQSWKRRATPVVPLHGPLSYHSPWELYDLQSDPHELTNVAHDPHHSDTFQELRKNLAAWMTSTNDPLLAGAVTSPLHNRTTQALLAWKLPTTSQARAKRRAALPRSGPREAPGPPEG